MLSTQRVGVHSSKYATHSAFKKCSGLEMVPALLSLSLCLGEEEGVGVASERLRTSAQAELTWHLISILLVSLPFFC